MFVLRGLAYMLETVFRELKGVLLQMYCNGSSNTCND